MTYSFRVLLIVIVIGDSLVRIFFENIIMLGTSSDTNTPTNWQIYDKIIWAFWIWWVKVWTPGNLFSVQYISNYIQQHGQMFLILNKLHIICFSGDKPRSAVLDMSHVSALDYSTISVSSEHNFTPPQFKIPFWFLFRRRNLLFLCSCFVKVERNETIYMYIHKT